SRGVRMALMSHLLLNRQQRRKKALSTFILNGNACRDKCRIDGFCHLLWEQKFRAGTAPAVAVVHDQERRLFLGRLRRDQDAHPTTRARAAASDIAWRGF